MRKFAGRKEYEPQSWHDVDTIASVICLLWSHVGWFRMDGARHPEIVRQICDAWDELCKFKQDQWDQVESGRVMCQKDSDTGGMRVYLYVGDIEPREVEE